MKSYNKLLKNDELDIIELLKLIWKDKFLYFTLIFIITILGYIFGIFQTKIYKTEVIVRDPPNSLFYLSSFINISQAEVANNYNVEFHLNILSFDNLILFVEQNNNLEDFKSYLKEKKIDKKTYFKNNFGPDKKIKNRYFLKHTKHINGNEFLKDYILFTKQQTQKKILKYSSKIILDHISIYERHYDIADKINLAKPILKSMSDNDTLGNEPAVLFYTLKSMNEVLAIENETYAYFYKGTEVLSEILIQLNNLLNRGNYYNLDYNPVLDGKNYTSKLISLTPISSSAIAFVFGLIFSAIIVCIKNLIKK